MDGIRIATLDMNPGKLSGLDSFSGHFFTACWAIIKSDLFSVVLHFQTMNHGKLHLVSSSNLVFPPHVVLGG